MNRRRKNPHPESLAHQIVTMFDDGMVPTDILPLVDTNYLQVIYTTLRRWRPRWREVVKEREEASDA